MKLSAARIKKLCARHGLSLQALLESAGVSRTAYYSLVRKNSILPASVQAIAGTLGIAPSAILEDAVATLRQRQRGKPPRRRKG